MACITAMICSPRPHPTPFFSFLFFNLVGIHLCSGIVVLLSNSHLHSFMYSFIHIAVHASAFQVCTIFDLNFFCFQFWLQFTVRYFTDRVCHIHFGMFFATVHSHFGFDQEENLKIFLVDFNFISVSLERTVFPLLCIHSAAVAPHYWNVAQLVRKSDSYSWKSSSSVPLSFQKAHARALLLLFYERLCVLSS